MNKAFTSGKVIMCATPRSKNYSDEYIGLEMEVPLLQGGRSRYINFDNAASTPALKAVGQAVNDFLTYYSSVHRGTGFKSQLSTEIYEQARRIVLDFVGAGRDEHVCIFGKNTTEAINKLARRFPVTEKRNVILTSGLEHHSNDLPWRATAKVVHIGLTADGRIDEEDFDEQLSRYAERVALVAISGASNVTGYLPPIHHLAEKAHQVGAQIAVDCAQLAPHRKIEMRSLADPDHLDYVTISAHKMYAPFGTGALIGRRDTFEQGDPDLVGGGTVNIVTLDDVTWAEPPERDEAGSPNVIGAVALAAAIRKLEEIGMDAVARHEDALTCHTLGRLADLAEVNVYGDTDPARASSRLGVIPLNVEGYPHALTAAILSHEFGIGVRNGCFCAHPYLLHLLAIPPEEADRVRADILAGDRSNMPGLVRISFGLYNTLEEVDALVEALAAISRGEYQGTYEQDSASGAFHPRGWEPDFESYFTI
jgi:selenocysteine lyase/cysteine desulfurase